MSKKKTCSHSLCLKMAFLLSLSNPQSFPIYSSFLPAAYCLQYAFLKKDPISEIQLKSLTQ